MRNRDLLIGAGIGAALAFMLDPNSGGRRRALVRDKMVRAGRKTRDGLDAAARDTANRTRGIAASARGWIGRQTVDDERLVERVRAKLGRVCTHPRAIDVVALNGDVTLGGPILESEMNGVLATVADISGVCSVMNAMEPHASAAGVPSLQGEGRLPAPRFARAPWNWTPATQALVAAAGVSAIGASLAYARR